MSYRSVASGGAGVQSNGDGLGARSVDRADRSGSAAWHATMASALADDSVDEADSTLAAVVRALAGDRGAGAATDTPLGAGAVGATARPPGSPAAMHHRLLFSQVSGVSASPPPSAARGPEVAALAAGAAGRAPPHVDSTVSHALALHDSHVLRRALRVQSKALVSLSDKNTQLRDQLVAALDEAAAAARQLDGARADARAEMLRAREEWLAEHERLRREEQGDAERRAREHADLVAALREETSTLIGELEGRQHQLRVAQEECARLRAEVDEREARLRQQEALHDEMQQQLARAERRILQLQGHAQASSELQALAERRAAEFEDRVVRGEGAANHREVVAAALDARARAAEDRADRAEREALELAETAQHERDKASALAASLRAALKRCHHAEQQLQREQLGDSELAVALREARRRCADAERRAHHLEQALAAREEAAAAATSAGAREALSPAAARFDGEYVNATRSSGPSASRGHVAASRQPPRADHDPIRDVSLSEVLRQSRSLLQQAAALSSSSSLSPPKRAGRSPGRSLRDTATPAMPAGRRRDGSDSALDAAMAAAVRQLRSAALADAAASAVGRRSPRVER